jgi:hypothetical protein
LVELLLASTACRSASVLFGESIDWQMPAADQTTSASKLV